MEVISSNKDFKMFLSHTVGLCWAKAGVERVGGTCQDLLLYEWNETARVASSVPASGPTGLLTGSASTPHSSVPLAP